LVGLQSTPIAADAEAAKSEDLKSSDDSSVAKLPGTSSETGDSDVITIHGQVVDPDGKPFASAKVQIARWYWDKDLEQVALAKTNSGPDGRFVISYRKSQFNVDLQRPDMWKEVSVVATAAGFGPGWVERDDLAAGQEPTLQL